MSRETQELVDYDQLEMLIAGTGVHGDGSSITVYNPATEQAIASVGGASPGQLDSALRAARHAFDEGPWPRLAPSARRAALTRIADSYERQVDVLRHALISELGYPIAVAEYLQVRKPIEHLRHFAEAADRDWTEQLGPNFDPVPSASKLVYRPVGVVAALAAYNSPLVLAIWKLGAALAAGCTTVLAPSPKTPLSTLLLAQAIMEADLPPGVVNVVVGDVAITKQLTESDLVDKIAFTGSSAVGRMIMQQASSTMTDVMLELGGKSPAIVLPDADLAEITRPLHLRWARGSGQACAAPTRILVQRSRMSEFLSLSADAVNEIVVGDPWDPKTFMGPLIRPEHRDSIERAIAAAVANGATIVAGGDRPQLETGWYLNPTVITDVDNQADIARRELFGPVTVVMPYDTVNEAVRIANDSPYTLAAYLYGGSLEQCMDISSLLRAGVVTINGGGGFRPDAPQGGFGRRSGFGREMGDLGIKEYLYSQHVQWAMR